MKLKVTYFLTGQPNIPSDGLFFSKLTFKLELKKSEKTRSKCIMLGQRDE